MSKSSSKCNCSMISRRRFLASLTSAPLLGYSASPAMALLSAILAGESQKAWAAELGLNPRRLVLLTEEGGPAKYNFQILTPYSTANFAPNAMTGTQFAMNNGRYIGTQYVTHAVKGIQVPTIWTQGLPAPGGGMRSMADLLDNLLSVQGINTKSGGHEQSAFWAEVAPGAVQSTSALAGDALSVPFSALNLGNRYFQYKSISGKTAVTPSMSTGGGENPLTKLLGPFAKVGSSQFKTKKADALVASKQLWRFLDELAVGGHVGAQSVVQNRGSAVALYEKNFGDLIGVWNTLKGKYQDLVSRAIYDPEHPFPGFNDLPIGEGGSTANLLYQVNKDTTFPLHLAGDVRDTIVAATTVNGLADNFAMTEFVLLNNLCGSISFNVYGLDKIKNVMTASPVEISMYSDQHDTGTYPSMYYNMLRYRAISACLLELITQLRGAQMFDDTVIRWGGEFVRNPRNDEFGSDHGWEGAAYDFYCGKFNGPLVVGKLTADDRGTWGKGAVVPALGRVLSLSDLAILTAHLLRVPAPFTNGTPIVTLSSNGLVSNIGLQSHI